MLTPIRRRSAGLGASVAGRRRLPPAVLAAAVGAMAVIIGTGAPAGAVPAGMTAVVADAQVSVIQADQAQVVRIDHSQPITAAVYAVDQLQADLGHDQSVLSGDQSVASHASAVKAAAEARLGTDEQGLSAATAAARAADATLAADRAQMQAIAIGMYTGQLTNPQPAGLEALEQAQQAIIDAAEVAVVARVLHRHIVADVIVDRADHRRRAQLASAVTSDTSTAASASSIAASHQARVAGDQAVVAGDLSRLSGAHARLDAAEGALQRALGRVETGGSAALSILGGAALDAAQLVAWYDYQGFADLDSTSVRQYAQWYLQAGAEEGVRGDVAFIQAVLETGGFSSPDSIDYNNYAGIGHCDSCSSGWNFPSPYDGVVGQTQLLRIFAGGGSPTHPVLASLTTARQYKAGCCSSFESLTGVWASDPTYGSHILGLYQQALELALSG